MWNAARHSEDENVRWAWLRANEWVNWPLFLSQPIIPVLLYFVDWPILLGAIVVITFFWRTIIVPFWVAPALADAGALLVKLRFLTAPVMAYLLWRRGDTPIAVAAGLWPLLGVTVALTVLAIPEAMISFTRLGKASQFGPVQARFLRAIGLQPQERRTP